MAARFLGNFAGLRERARPLLAQAGISGNVLSTRDREHGGLSSQQAEPPVPSPIDGAGEPVVIVRSPMLATCPKTAVGVTRPLLGQKQTQPVRRRNLGVGQGERDPRSAVCSVGCDIAEPQQPSTCPSEARLHCRIWE
jgi:hypothetical protein